MGSRLLTAIEIIGGILVVVGVGMLSVPAGLIVAGILTIVGVEAAS